MPPILPALAPRSGDTNIGAPQAILQQQVTAIQEFDSADFADLARLALAIGDGGVATSAAAAANGGAPATPRPETPAAPET